MWTKYHPALTGVTLRGPTSMSSGHSETSRYRVVLQSEDDPFQDVVGSEVGPEIQRISDEGELWEHSLDGLLSQ